jgi:hypothetical protein
VGAGASAEGVEDVAGLTPEAYAAGDRGKPYFASRAS